MNQQRAESILDNQTALAQRVFKCVPIQEWWTVHQIANELDRRGPHNHTKTILGGCLRTLKEAGLVTEGPKDTYRSAVKPQIKLPKSIGPMGQIDDKAAPVQLDLASRLANKANELRKLAESLDMLALEIDDEITKASKAGSEKLRMLRELLSE